MEISTDDLARILGRIEGKLDVQASATKRLEDSVASLDSKVTRRLDDHDQRLRELEIANPKKLAETVKSHEERIRKLETGEAKTGAVAGIASSVVVGAIIEFLRRMGH